MKRAFVSKKITHEPILLAHTSKYYCTIITFIMLFSCIEALAMDNFSSSFGKKLLQPLSKTLLLFISFNNFIKIFEKNKRNILKNKS